MRQPRGKVTRESLAMLEKEAAIRMQRTSYKQLAKDTGLSPGHVAKVIWNLMHRNENSVSRGPKLTEAQLDELAAKLMGEE